MSEIPQFIHQVMPTSSFQKKRAAPVKEVFQTNLVHTHNRAREPGENQEFLDQWITVSVIIEVSSGDNWVK